MCRSSTSLHVAMSSLQHRRSTRGERRDARPGSVLAPEGEVLVLHALQGELEGTKGELARAQENLNAKKKLAEQIMKNFAAKGVNVQSPLRY